MHMIDALAAAPSRRWSDGDVSVARVDRGRTLSVRRDGARLRVRHRLGPGDLRDSLALRIAAEAGSCDVSEFERMLVGVVRTTIPDAAEAWRLYYRNSMADLESGAAEFAPVHTRAIELLAGRSVLDLGSCFGFFALRAAQSGREVTATDVCAGTMTLLDTVAQDLGIAVTARTADATRTGLPDRYADTVTVIHLLEHLPGAVGDRVVDEALRLARRRVVIAVPFEDEPDPTYGHVRTFTLADLDAIGRRSSLDHKTFEHHGGWLVMETER